MSENTHREKFYLTTPIYYVNARPHIGHAYSTLVADVLARRHRLLGDDTFFLTGTDEHGQKIERSAAAAGVPPQEFADTVSKTFSDLWKRMGITNDAFIRTTDPRHKRGVQQLFTTLYEQGHIYLSTYTGQYSIGEEMFVDGPPGTIGPDGRPTETVTEENFFFRLSAFQKPLLDLIESDTLKITPESSRNEVLSFVRGGLKDLSVSRSSFTWGIPVPEEVQQGAGATQKHVIYVWLDALANYMTAIGYGSEAEADQEQFARYWPANLHLVGKEITRFHCVYWPAFLLALNPAVASAARGPSQPSSWATSAAEVSAEEHGLPPVEAAAVSFEEHTAWAAKWVPKQVTANGWLLFDNAKMSKSKGNVVRTETILDGFGEHVYKKQFPNSTKAEQDLFAADVLRYFLLREIPFGQDGTFSFESMVTRYNADLANGYGNLVSRTLSMIEKYYGGTIPMLRELEEIRLAARPYSGRVATTLTPVIPLIRQTGVALHSYDEAVSLMLFSASINRGAEPVSDTNKMGMLDATFLLIRESDTFLTKMAPWKELEGSDFALLRADSLYAATECIRIVTALLYPILPNATAKVWQQLGLGDIEHAAKNGELKNLKWGDLTPGTKLGPLAPIFPRADKSLPQVMAEMEVATPPLAKGVKDGVSAGSPALGEGTPTLFREDTVMPTEDTSQQPAVAETHPAAPLKDQSTPTPALEVAEDPTHPAAPPRTSSLEVENAGGHVAGSHAVTTERTGTPPHQEAQASGIFAGGGAPDTPQIGIDDFTKIDLRVAKILVAERIPKADKLLRLEVDLGYERRQILSGIAEHYTPEELVGKKIVILANLAPRTMRGLESRGMLLAASEGADGRPILATFGEEIAVGTRLR